MEAQPQASAEAHVQVPVQAPSPVQSPAPVQAHADQVEVGIDATMQTPPSSHVLDHSQAPVNSEVEQEPLDHVNETKVQESFSKWIEKQKVFLAAISTVVLSLVGNFLVNPPGGFVPLVPPKEATICTKARPCEPGTAINSYSQPEVFEEFMKYGWFSMVLSINIVFCLLFGFPFYKKFTAFTYTVLMLLSLVFAFITMDKGIQMVLSGSLATYSGLDIRSIAGGALAIIWIPALAFCIFLIQLGKIAYKKMDGEA